MRHLLAVQDLQLSPFRVRKYAITHHFQRLTKDYPVTLVLIDHIQGRSIVMKCLVDVSPKRKNRH